MARHSSANDVVRQAKRCSLAPRVGCPVPTCAGRECELGRPTIVNAPTGYSSLAMSLGVLPMGLDRLAPLEYQPVKCCGGGRSTGSGACCGRKDCCVCPPPPNMPGPGGPFAGQVQRFGNSRPGLATKNPGFVKAGKPVVWTRPAFRCVDGLAVPDLTSSPYCGPILPPGGQSEGESIQATAWSAATMGAFAGPASRWDAGCNEQRAGTPLYSVRGTRVVPCGSAGNCSTNPEHSFCSTFQAELFRNGVPSGLSTGLAENTEGGVQMPAGCRDPCCATA